MNSAGLEAAFLQHRDALLRFFRAHGAGMAAEDLVQDLWLRVRDARSGPIAQPLSYLYRAANNLMIDRHRSERQARLREQDWSDTAAPTVPGRSDEPAADRRLIGREAIARVEAVLAALGPRAERIFRRHRLDGLPQRAVAAELGVGLSTVEADLRRAVAALAAVRAEIEQGTEGGTPS